MSAKIICVEGPDGVGKDTQIQNLYNTLTKQGKRVKILDAITKDNNSINYTDICKYLKEENSGISDSEYLVRIIAELYKTNHTINSIINTDDIIILNRWFYSTYIYNGHNTMERTIIHYLTKELVTPDYLFILTANYEECLLRIENRGKGIQPFELQNIRYACIEYKHIQLSNSTLTILKIFDTSNKDKDSVYNEILDYIYSENI